MESYRSESYRSIVGVFPNARAVQQTVNDLKADRFPESQISVIAQDTRSAPKVRRKEAPVRKAQGLLTAGAIAGGAIGGTAGFVVALGAIAAFPITAPTVLLGAIATTTAITIGGGVLGSLAGTLVGALMSYGIPKDHAVAYERQVHQGNCLVIVRGTPLEIEHARQVLTRRQAREVRVYDALLEQDVR